MYQKLNVKVIIKMTAKDVNPTNFYVVWNITFIDDDYLTYPQRGTMSFPCVLKRTDDGFYETSYKIFPRLTWFRKKLDLTPCGVVSKFSFSFFRGDEEYSMRLCSVEPILKDEFANFHAEPRKLTDDVFDSFMTVGCTCAYETAETYPFTYEIIEERHTKYLCGFHVRIPIHIVEKMLSHFQKSHEQCLKLSF
jgi:hypothetical protein